VLWFFIWVALVIGAIAVLGALAFGLFRKGRELAHERGGGAELLSQAAEKAERLQGPATDGPAVFADPHDLRRQRERRRKQRQKHRRGSALTRSARRTMRTTQAGG